MRTNIIPAVAVVLLLAPLNPHVYAGSFNTVDPDNAGYTWTANNFDSGHF